jgi:hypothetical protein
VTSFTDGSPTDGSSVRDPQGIAAARREQAAGPVPGINVELVKFVACGTIYAFDSKGVFGLFLPRGVL